ncbi:Cytochrome c oxidase biogenesis protein Cmc1-like protein [Moelleriella libera RCEF 2490]|uniref:Cytochrome c oxidase biogenesis protein Cmc1-like protein n=1 Tax=Moelleriella libera RCEF 2490 TaxID=1081109 RepID=A0A167X7R7_9HYPO|nr:Cytochrome c oxidase biogenesis protein Cmc1-like protein [Moelleriella libera RCEF 2490]
MENGSHHQHTPALVLRTPIWITLIRCLQFLLSLVVVGLAARVIHDVFIDELGLSVATGVLTWIVLVYVFFSEKSSSLHVAYNAIAVLVLEGILVIMWLATFAAVAARRATFRTNVSISNCFNDGSSVNSKYCYKKRDAGAAIILFKTGADLMSANAGVGALLWILFVITFAWSLVAFLRARKAAAPATAAAANTYQMETKTDHHPGAPGVHYQQQQSPPPPTQLQQQPTGPYQPSPVSPYQQQQQQQYPAYQTPPPGAGSPPPHQHQQVYNGNYAPQQQQPQQQQQPPQQYYQRPHYQGSELSAESQSHQQPQQQHHAPADSHVSRQQAPADTAMKPEAPPQERLGVPSRNPLPLSASQEAQVRDVFYARVRQQCAEEIKAFAACALGRTFTVSFACRAEHRVMNNCMKLHATPEEHDAAREEWFAMRMERHRQRERKAKMAAAQEEFIREWWGLPEEVRLSKQRDLERLGKAERVGGMAAKERPHGPDAR